MTAPVAIDLLAAALEYAGRNKPVFPAYGVASGRCGCGRYPCGEGNHNAGKHPHGRLALNGFKDATSAENTVRHWWTLEPSSNIATPTNWCIVLDVDPRNGGDETLAELERKHGSLPDTAEVLTGGGGRHVYFAPIPGFRSKNGVALGLDIKAEGGYVLLPPSNHVSGRQYIDEILHPLFDTPLAPLPRWLVELATTIGPSQRNGNESAGSETDWGALLRGAPIGQRRSIALRIAGHFLGKREAPGTVVELLLAFGRQCSPPYDDEEDFRRLVRDLAERDRSRNSTTATAPAETAAAASSGSPVLVCLGDVEPENVEWLWERRIPRSKISLGIGEVGTGKTTITLDVAARITRGAAWPDGGRAPVGDVLLLTSEDGLADTVRPIVDRQGGDARRVHVLKAVRVEGQECPFTLERDLPALDAAIQQTRAILVVISPLSAYLGSRDSYKDAEIRGLLTPLAALAERRRVAIFGVMHLTKAQTRRLLLRAQGSVAFVAQARTVLVVGEVADTPGRRLLASCKNNLGPQASALAFRITDAGLTWEDAPIEGTAEVLLAADEPVSRSDRRERDHAVTFLRELLADGPTASKQVLADAKANGIAQRTLWRAKTDLGVKAERAKGQTGPWYWMLPATEPEPFS